MSPFVYGSDNPTYLGNPKQSHRRWRWPEPLGKVRVSSGNAEAQKQLSRWTGHTQIQSDLCATGAHRAGMTKSPAPTADLILPIWFPSYSTVISHIPTLKAVNQSLLAHHMFILAEEVLFPWQKLKSWAVLCNSNLMIPCHFHIANHLPKCKSVYNAEQWLYQGIDSTVLSVCGCT